MKHARDEQPPAEDARPMLPTEIEYPAPADQRARRYPPAADARPLLPTEIEPSAWPAQTGPAYQSAQAGRAGEAPEFTRSGRAGEAPEFTRSGRAGPVPEFTRSGRAGPVPEFTRSGPGVPASSPAGTSHTAERVWRTGHADESPRRPHRWRGRAGTALTVILLAASAMVLYLRFHHAPFHVTGVAITQRTHNGCGLDVTGQISTNGAAGTISYQWLTRPDGQAPQPLSESVAAGQNAAYVTVAVQGSGHGSASRTVTLQVLGPDFRSVSTSVTLRC